MNVPELIGRLERFVGVLPPIVTGLSEEDARWRPEATQWSILEIVCHLRDEETDDFRTRVRMTLEDPTAAWPPIDPEGVAVSRKYNEQKLHDATAAFLEERRKSVAWLRSLRDVDWTNAFQHPKVGALHAGDIFVSWVAHDALHLRQLAKRMFQLAERDGKEFQTRYAGTW